MCPALCPPHPASKADLTAAPDASPLVLPLCPGTGSFPPGSAEGALWRRLAVPAGCPDPAVFLFLLALAQPWAQDSCVLCFLVPDTGLASCLADASSTQMFLPFCLLFWIWNLVLELNPVSFLVLLSPLFSQFGHLTLSLWSTGAHSSEWQQKVERLHFFNPKK